MVRCALLVAVLVAVLTPAPGAPADIPVELRFDGQAVRAGGGPGLHLLQRDARPLGELPGAEGRGARRLRARAPRAGGVPDARQHRREPGQPAPLTRATTRPSSGSRSPRTGPERLIVDLPRLIHLTRPGDNARSLEGMLRSCATQPRSRRRATPGVPAADVEFAWEPVVGRRRVPLQRGRRAVRPAGRGAGDPERDDGRDHWWPSTCRRAADGEHYVFRVEAWKDDRLVGDLYTHDGGAHSWNYRFRVVDASLPRWVYLAAGVGLARSCSSPRVAALASRRSRGAGAAGVGSRAGALAACSSSGAVAGAVYHYHRDREHRPLEAETASREAERQARQREFIAAFASAAPRPDWWDRVRDAVPGGQPGRPALRLAGISRAATRRASGNSSRPPTRASSITPTTSTSWPPPSTSCTGSCATIRTASPLARFGYERYLRHRGRTDNCVNCMVGDTAQALALNLSKLHDRGRSLRRGHRGVPPADRRARPGREPLQAGGDMEPDGLVPTGARASASAPSTPCAPRSRATATPYGGTISGGRSRGSRSRARSRPRPAERLGRAAPPLVEGCSNRRLDTRIMSHYASRS